MKLLHREDVPRLIERIRRADIVLAVNQGKDILVYGRSVAERIVSSGKNENLNVMRVPIDINTDDLEMLIAAIMTVHGSHDYVAALD